ncbi:Sec-independent protein translocase subunit TatB [Pseudidiomarina sp. 1ASP75-14]|uniref:Sec-independent protein translocase protein TatB n=1 Tax=Pseudidiomarina terrestris TaxID=2820060 RepID=UPI002655F45F|nr:Sec-independent protein translocase protein TatB [Pseudidiomarina sp. 1ASP75-14]MDN7138167.1 Sec-independent protein translocase subunit TatB [Pseudidiomarina sp. 1ASP75-14]
MFDIGFWELLFVALIGLLVLGPERLPGALRGLQRGMQKLKTFGTSVQAELNHELRIKELHEHLKKAEQMEVDKLSPELQRSMAELREAAAGVQRPYEKKKPSSAGDDGDSGTSSAADKDESKPSS